MSAKQEAKPDLTAIAAALDEQVKKEEAANVSGLLSAKEAASKFSINPELESLLEPLSEQETAELTQGILDDGIREPLTIWLETGNIVDGHNRFKIGVKLDADIPFHKRAFPSIDEVKKWMIRNQLGRRNLTKQRFEYLIGSLYNQMKQTDKAREAQDQPTADAIAETYGVSPRTVRRAADTAAGIDMIERVKGKLAKAKQLGSNEPEAKDEPVYTKEELAVLGKVSSPTVAKKTMEVLDKDKKAEAEKKAAAKEKASARKPDPQAGAAKTSSAPKLYPVALIAPKFDAQFKVANLTRPPMDKDSVLYIVVPDEHLTDGLDIITRWGFQYECQFIFQNGENYVGTFSKIIHTSLLVATKGNPVGPKKGKEVPSVQQVKSVETMIVHLIDGYHPNDRKLDFRNGGKGDSKNVPNNWHAINQ